MKIETLAVGPLQSNCHIVSDGESPECIIVDPGGDADRIVQAVEEAGLRPRWIVNTHCHGDHIAANAALKERWPEALLAAHRLDAPGLTSQQLNLSFLLGTPFTSPKADRELVEGDEVEAGAVRLRVLHVPGHSPGGICLVAEGDPPVALVGDALFAGGVGRTDFPGGSGEELARNIREKLYALPDATHVLPGHGPETTIGAERQTNPFVRDG